MSFINTMFEFTSQRDQLANKVAVCCCMCHVNQQSTINNQQSTINNQQSTINNFMELGTGNRGWKVEFIREGAKWANPLMGWTSSGDTTQQLNEKLYFDSKQQAIDYALAQG